MNGLSVYRKLCQQNINRMGFKLPKQQSFIWNRFSKRFIELPPYHPKYKKPEMVYDLNLDWRKYRGIFRIIPVPPRARPAVYVFAAFIFLEYFAFVCCHHMMLRD
eukprot:37137_1